MPWLGPDADDAGLRGVGGRTVRGAAVAHTLIDPALVGPLVLAATLENLAHIFTHGEYAASISARNEELLADIATVPVRGGSDKL